VLVLKEKKRIVGSEKTEEEEEKRKRRVKPSRRGGDSKSVAYVLMGPVSKILGHKCIRAPKACMTSC
jgi:hypothetical protein